MQGLWRVRVLVGWVCFGMAMLAACGGTAVIDRGSSGSGGSSSVGSGAGESTADGSMTTSASANSTGAAAGGASAGSCDELFQLYELALAEATRCAESCAELPAPCAYLSGVQLTDECGCPIPVVSGSEAVAKAVEAYNAWTVAGCGPYPCGPPCAVSESPACLQNDSDCVGICAP